ncbi:MAG: NfeD family protein [Rikenellaceae bacterium]
METLTIIVLIILGLLFLMVELLLIPGLSIGGIISLGCYSWASYLAFTNHSVVVGGVTVAVIIAISLIAITLSLRAKTWQRLSLNSKIESQSSTPVESRVALGSSGVTLSRLAPMGRVNIDGQNYEAKSTGVYIDTGCDVEVI